MRKTTVIPAKAGIHFMFFAFVFAFDSDSREGAPHPSPERMRWIYMAASVSFPAGREDVRAKGQRQRRKWIPAFAGMTADCDHFRLSRYGTVGTGPRACPKSPFYKGQPQGVVPTDRNSSRLRGVFQQPPQGGSDSNPSSGVVLLVIPAHAENQANGNRICSGYG